MYSEGGGKYTSIMHSCSYTKSTSICIDTNILYMFICTTTRNTYLFMGVHTNMPIQSYIMHDNIWHRGRRATYMYDARNCGII